MQFSYFDFSFLRQQNIRWRSIETEGTVIVLLIINTEERLKQRLLDTCKTAVSKCRK